MNKPIRPKVAERVCLKCNKAFLSDGPGNRICKACTRVNAQLGTVREDVLAKERGAKRWRGYSIDVSGSYETHYSD